MRKWLTSAMYVLLLGGTMSVAACGSNQNESGSKEVTQSEASASNAVHVSDVRYSFDSPAASLPLVDELKEISGVTLISGDQVAAIQDEAGILYILNAKTARVEQKIPFAEGADFEGIARVDDNRIFVLQSNGTLHEVTNWKSGKPQVRTFDTALKSKNDTEGLVYDGIGNRLLIATKEDPGADLKKKEHRAIYAFDLKQNQFIEEPVMTIEVKAVEDRIKQKGGFKPSALAIGKNGEVYVLSSVAKAIAVLDRTGSLKDVWELPENTYEQPEGLTFMDDGTLLVASEGVKGPAMLHRISTR